MTRRTLAILLLLAIPLGVGSLAQARPTYKATLARFAGMALAKRLNDCRTCHTASEDDDSAQINGRTLNVYGQRLRKVIPELRAVKKRAGITDRLEAIADEDTDGDGASNLVELFAGRFPGDPKDTPSVEERERAQHAIAASRARSDEK